MPVAIGLCNAHGYTFIAVEAAVKQFIYYRTKVTKSKTKFCSTQSHYIYRVGQKVKPHLFHCCRVSNTKCARKNKSAWFYRYLDICSQIVLTVIGLNIL